MHLNIFNKIKFDAFLNVYIQEKRVPLYPLDTQCWLYSIHLSFRARGRETSFLRLCPQQSVRLAGNAHCGSEACSRNPQTWTCHNKIISKQTHKPTKNINIRHRHKCTLSGGRWCTCRTDASQFPCSGGSWDDIVAQTHGADKAQSGRPWCKQRWVHSSLN